MKPARIVSLLPSATETVFALGAGERLVGRSHECDFPAEVGDLPACTQAKLAGGLSSAGIDARVRALVARGLSLYEVDVAALARLEPGLILTQTQCEVCAVSEAELKAALDAVVAPRPELVSLAADTLDGVFDDMLRVAGALGEAAAGEALVAHIKARMSAVEERVADARTRPTVVCLEWLDPPMTAGHWLPRLVDMAGGEELLGRAGTASTRLDWPALKEADPDVLILLPCGFAIAESRRDLPSLTARPGWTELKAVAGGRVAIADGRHYFNRPGPRLVESLEILAEILHPEHVERRYRGIAWEAL